MSRGRGRSNLLIWSCGLDSIRILVSDFGGLCRLCCAVVIFFSSGLE